MIDFHSHIIWNVDDGSKDMDMSIDMINNSIDENVKGICATPHFILEEHELDLEDYFNKLNNLKEFYGNKIKVLSGLELYINPKLPEYYKDGRIFGLNHSRYLLIELPMRDFPIYTKDVFYELSILGATPVIAHPERNLKIQQNPELLKDLLAEGALAQMNAGSLTGDYGKTVQKIAENFIDKNLVQIIGSDGHNNIKRKTNVLEAHRRVEKLNKELYYWIEKNSEKIINNIVVDPLKVKDNKKLNIFSFFKNG